MRRLLSVVLVSCVLITVHIRSYDFLVVAIGLRGGGGGGEGYSLYAVYVCPVPGGDVLAVLARKWV